MDFYRSRVVAGDIEDGSLAYGRPGGRGFQRTPHVQPGQGYYWNKGPSYDDTSPRAHRMGHFGPFDQAQTYVDNPWNQLSDGVASMHFDGPRYRARIRTPQGPVTISRSWPFARRAQRYRDIRIPPLPPSPDIKSISSFDSSYQTNFNSERRPPSTSLDDTVYPEQYAHRYELEGSNIAKKLGASFALKRDWKLPELAQKLRISEKELLEHVSTIGELVKLSWGGPEVGDLIDEVDDQTAGDLLGGRGRGNVHNSNPRSGAPEPSMPAIQAQGSQRGGDALNNDVPDDKMGNRTVKGKAQAQQTPAGNPTSSHEQNEALEFEDITFLIKNWDLTLSTLPNFQKNPLADWCPQTLTSHLNIPIPFAFDLTHRLIRFFTSKSTEWLYWLSVNPRHIQDIRQLPNPAIRGERAQMDFLLLMRDFLTIRGYEEFTAYEKLVVLIKMAFQYCHAWPITLLADMIGETVEAVQKVLSKHGKVSDPQPDLPEEERGEQELSWELVTDPCSGTLFKYIRVGVRPPKWRFGPRGDESVVRGEDVKGRDEKGEDGVWFKRPERYRYWFLDPACAVDNDKGKGVGRGEGVGFGERGEGNADRALGDLKEGSGLVGGEDFGGQSNEGKGKWRAL